MVDVGIVVIGAVALVPVLAAVLVAVLVAVLLSGGATPGPFRRGAAVLATQVPIAILGDSDSQSYQGRIPFTPGDPPAGGVFHATTLQWPDVLARLRGAQVDLGEWGVWGVRRRLSMARVRDGLGLRWRAPRKEDYRHNLAFPSRCADLHHGAWRQVPRLIDVLDEDPPRWQRGIVVVRIGINDFGKDSLDDLALDPNAPAVLGVIHQCLADIRQVVERVRAKHPRTAIVLVGIFDNAHWRHFLGKFRSAEALANISRGLDHFDDGLRALAAAQPGIAFFDDRAWFATHWGGRDADGLPAYKTVAIGQRLRVTNSAGDGPENAVLANGHAGLVWNVLWVQALVDVMRAAFGAPIDAVGDAEAARFIDTLLGHDRAVS